MLKNESCRRAISELALANQNMTNIDHTYVYQAMLFQKVISWLVCRVAIDFAKIRFIFSQNKNEFICQFCLKSQYIAIFILCIFFLLLLEAKALLLYTVNSRYLMEQYFCVMFVHPILHKSLQYCKNNIIKFIIFTFSKDK